MEDSTSHEQPQQQCSFFFALPTEIQLLVMSRLSLSELHNAKLINKRFHSLANVDQLWRRLIREAKIEAKAMKEAKETCGSRGTWQQLLRTATLIERENKRLMQGTIAQMAQKINQVREALQRQTQVLEETHTKLEVLSGRLTQMEQQNRARELERARARERERQRVEDEIWIKEWDKMCLSSETREIDDELRTQESQQGRPKGSRDYSRSNERVRGGSKDPLSDPVLKNDQSVGSQEPGSAPASFACTGEGQSGRREAGASL